MQNFDASYVEFTTYVELHGWQKARAWLKVSSGWTCEVVDAILSRAGKGNLEKIRIHPSDLTGNRMRKTAELR